MRSMGVFVLASASLVAAMPAQHHVRSLNQADARAHNVRQPQSGSSKKGLAHEKSRGDVLDVFAGTGGVGWAYDWSPNPDSAAIKGIPMCWGAQADCHADVILQQIGSNAVEWVLGYNEPDLLRDENVGGSFLTPQAAYDSWGNDMFPFAEAGARLVCPGVSSYDTTVSKFTGFESGLTWLRSFVSLSSSPDDLRCDAQALHWYGPEEEYKSGSEQADLFIEYMEDAHDTVNDIFGRDVPIWITEFGPVPENDVQVLSDFMDKAVVWLEKQPWVARYSPFKPQQMFNADGSLNDAGNSFLNP